MRRSPWIKVVLLGPAVAVVLATVGYPLVSAAMTSFRTWKLNESSEPGPFVGLANYVKAIKDEAFHNSIIVTLEFTVISVVLSLVIGLGIALLLQRRSRINTLTKTVLILPFAVAPVLKGFSWRFMLNADYGIYDHLVNTALPFTDGIIWLGNAFWALITLALSEVWGWAPLIALMLVGALGSISPEIYDAAKVDGATGWAIFRHITLPLLAPVLVIAALLKTIWSLKMFDQVVSMTGGGPGTSTETLNFFIYREGFNFLDMGYASALGWLLTLVLAVFAVVYVRVLMKGAR